MSTSSTRLPPISPHHHHAAASTATASPATATTAASSSIRRVNSGSAFRASARMQLMNDNNTGNMTHNGSGGGAAAGASLFPSGVSASFISSPSSPLSAWNTSGGGGGQRSMPSPAAAVSAAALAGEHMLRSAATLPSSSSSLSSLQSFGGSYETFRRYRADMMAATATAATTAANNNLRKVVPAITLSSSSGVAPAVLPALLPPRLPSLSLNIPVSENEAKRRAIRESHLVVRRQKRAARRSLPSNTFRSPLAAKPDRVHKMYIRRPTVLPVLTMHLAALHIQKLFRGKRARKMVQQLKIAANAATSGSDGASSSVTPHVSSGNEGKDEKALPSSRPRKPLYARYFAESGQTHLNTNGDGVTIQYQHWAARRIQNQWRYWKRRRHATHQRYAVYTAAARSIQRAWRKYADYLHNTRELPAREERAARRIQRCWRSWTDRRIFTYFKKLIINRQHSDPVMLIKSLNPIEAQLVDGASGLYVRFRLGGTMFPPVIYYKIFTRTAVTDIGSFAPRDYTRSRKVLHGRSKGVSHNHDGSGSSATFDSNDQSYWYRRWENNGWRPISEKLLWEQDHVVTSTSEKRVEYHHSRLVRQVDLLKKRKRKKLLWVKKMYAAGAAAAAGTTTTPAPDDDHKEEKVPLAKSVSSIHDNDDDDDEAAAAIREEVLRRLAAIDHNSDEVFNSHWEDEADDLLKWTKGLDFEEYHSTWFETATSRPADRSYREAFPAL